MIGNYLLRRNRITTASTAYSLSLQPTSLFWKDTNWDKKDFSADKCCYNECTFGELKVIK